MIVANLATYPARRGTLSDVVRSIIGRVDRLNIVFNQYDAVPDEFRGVPGVNAVIPDHDTRDTGKFYVDVSDADWVFFIDDDILYPPDYVDESLRLVGQLGLGAGLYGFHGSVYSRPRRRLRPSLKRLRNTFVPVERLIQNSRRNYRFTDTVEAPLYVDQIATNSALMPGRDVPPYDYMRDSQKFVDVRLARWCHERGLPVVCLPHEGTWMGELRFDETIYHGFTRVGHAHVGREILQFALRNPLRGMRVGTRPAVGAPSGVTDPFPRFSVIIPVYEGWDVLPKCLAALAAQTVPQSSFEVIVVNNQPGDALNFDMSAYAGGNVRFIDEARKGSYAARNAGIAAARGRILCFTDSDCVPAPHWLEEFGRIFDANPDVMRIGGEIRLTSERAEPTPSELYEFMYILKQERWVTTRGWAATANLAVRREVFDDVGLFDGSLVTRGDRIWGEEARNRGHAIAFSSEAWIEHPARATLQQLVTKSRRGASGYLHVRRATTHPALLGPKLLLRIIWKAVPSPAKFVRTLRHTDVSLRDRLAVFGIVHYVAWIQAVEAARLYFLGSEPERR